MDINARLKRLERENRRMKKVGIVATVFASVLFISGQAKTNKVVEANEFHLVDASGKVRARLWMMDTGPNLSFWDIGDHLRISISTSDEQSGISLVGPQSSEQITASSMWAGSPGKSGAGIGMTGPAGKFWVHLDGGVVTGPQLELEDKEGYSGVLGRSDLVVTATGKKEQTPAASLVLFDKDKKVLWSAP